MSSICFFQLNVFSTLPESSYDRPTPQLERALYTLVQEHLSEYDSASTDDDSNISDHATSERFKGLEKELLQGWADKVKSSIFGGDERVEL